MHRIFITPVRGAAILAIASSLGLAGNLLFKKFSVRGSERVQIPDTNISGEFRTEYIGIVPLLRGQPGSTFPALTNPRFDGPDEAHTWLKPEDTVVGVRIGQISKAYPTKILNYHEIVNDYFNEIPIAITYCPLAGAAIAFERGVNGGSLVFDVADVLFESTLVMQDRQTKSIWYQLRGEAIKGPLRGQTLVAHSAVLCASRYWFAKHPDTHVLSYLTGYSTNYASNYWRNPYRGYTNLYSPPALPVMRLDESIPPKELVLGVVIGGRAMAFRSTDLHRGEARLDLAGHKLIAHYSPLAEHPIAWWETSNGRNFAPIVPSYWFAWKAAYWNTEVWKSHSQGVK